MDQVGDELGHHDDQGEDQRDALYDGEVSVDDGIDDRLAEPGSKKIRSTSTVPNNR
ncbi:MAG: hypothetical protein R2705_05030 [Ilumatobacteraceae bacterium]